MPSPARLLLPLAVLAAAACADRPDGPNILLITLDTTRRDHLGFYGYERPTSPNLDRLAADSVVYTNAYAVSSWTMPTHASMFTGKFPSAHGAVYDPEGPLTLTEGIEGNYGAYRSRTIAENEITLAMLLTEHGYTTGGIVAGPWMKKVFHLNRGFEHYDDDNVTALNGRPAENVTDAAIAFVEEHADDPFFLFLNYYDPHSPWVDENRKPFHDLAPVWPRNVDPTKLGPAEQNAIVYDAEVRYMDKHIGRLLDHLRTEGLYEKTWIIVLSDHGELIGDAVLGDVGLWGHGDSLTQPEIHIPFLVKEPGPGARTGKEESFVQQVDILPTITQRLGIPLPPNVQGVPLGGASRHPIVAELVKLPMMNRTVGPGAKDWRHLGNWNVLVEGTTKYGWSSNGTNFLIDLARDPGERQNLAGTSAELAHGMQQRLTAFLQSLPPPGAVGDIPDVDAETREALRGLGYTGEDETGEDGTASEKPQAEEPAPQGDSAPR